MGARRYGRLATVHTDDSELHVDVMRFFAIIAMCLFAILPHTEAPNAVPVSGLLQQPAVIHLANLPMSNASAAAEQTQRQAKLPQSVSAVKTALPTTFTAQDTPRAPPPMERSVGREMPPLPVSTVASTASSQSENEPPKELASKQEQGVRFLNSDAFALAVTSGAITLVFHNQNESFVFDPSLSRFTRLIDASLQMFGLAASEVPLVFHRALPRIERANMNEAQWFITLPEKTLAYLLDAQKRNVNGAVLNDRAQPI